MDPIPLPGIGTAVDQLLAAANGLTPAALSAASPAELVAALEQLQRIANLTCTVEQALLTHAIDTDVLEEFGAARPQELLIGELITSDRQLECVARF